MVLLRGRRGFVILLWCLKFDSFDRVRPRAVKAKKQGKPRSTSLYSHCSPVSYVVRADVCGRFLTRTCFSNLMKQPRAGAVKAGLKRRSFGPVAKTTAANNCRSLAATV